MRGIPFRKRPTTSGVYLLRTEKDGFVCLVYVFFVPDRKSGSWFYSDYPLSKDIRPLDDSCLNYTWAFVEPFNSRKGTTTQNRK